MSPSVIPAAQDAPAPAAPAGKLSVTDLLILPDGTVLAHNLTSAIASVLHELNPGDEPMRQRAGLNDSLISPVVTHELPN